jgi:hypothetical protein
MDGTFSWTLGAAAGGLVGILAVDFESLLAFQ